MLTDRFKRVGDLIRAVRQHLFGRERNAELTKGAAGSFAVKVGGAALALLTQLALTRFLGVESYGKYIYAVTWMNVAMLVGTLGYETASVRFVAEYYAQQQWKLLRGFQRYSRSLVWKASIVLGGIMALAAWMLVTDPELLYAFWAASLLTPLLASLHVRASELRGLRRVVRALFLKEVFRPLLFLLGLLALIPGIGLALQAGHAILVYAGSALITVGVLALLIRRLLRPDVTRSDAEYRSGLWWRAARDMLLVASFDLILLRADTIMVGAFLGTDEAGLYAIASRVARLLVFILTAINTVLAPLAAELYATDEHAELQRVVTLGARAAIAVASVGAVILLVWDQEILGLFGPAFTASASALWILVGAQLVNTLAGSAVLLLNMTDHQQIAAKILGAGAVLNLLLNAVFIPLFGLVGAAWATTLTMIFWNVAANVSVWRTIRIVPTAFPWPSSWRT